MSTYKQFRVDCMTSLRAWFESAAQCTTKEEAETWLLEAIAEVRAVTACSIHEAESSIRRNLGYISGYYTIEVARRVYELYDAPHPILGTPDEREKLSPEDLFMLGQSLRKIAASKRVDWANN